MYEDYVSMCRDGIDPSLMGWDYRCDEEIATATATAMDSDIAHWHAMKALGNAMACNVLPILEVEGTRICVESGYPEPLPDNPYRKIIDVEAGEHDFQRYDFRPSRTFSVLSNQ